MEQKILTRAIQSLQEQRRRKKWHIIVRILAAIVVFCTTYALILPAITLEEELICGQEEHIHTEACYAEDMTLICGQEEHTHSAECYAKMTEPEPVSDNTAETELDTTEETDMISDTAADAEPQNDSAEEEEAQSEEPAVSEQDRIYTYEDDKIWAEVTLPADSTVPEDAVLALCPITDTDAAYGQLTQQAGEAVPGTVEKIVLYDISFYTAAQEYLSVADSAMVCLRFKETVISENSGDVTVLHYESGADVPVALETVDVEKDENENLAALSFRTEGFSIYAVVNVGESADQYITDLGGQEFVIANLNTAARQYAMTSVPNEDGNRLTATPVTVSEFKLDKDDNHQYVSGENLTLWQFEATGTPGVYYIQKATDTGQYLSLINGVLTTTETKQSITVTTSDNYPGQVRLSANNTAVDWYGGSNPNDLVFGPYNGTNQNDYQTLCKVLDDVGDALLYDLNVPSLASKGTGWAETPALESTVQHIDGDSEQLFVQPDGYFEEAGTAGISNLYRFNVSVMDDMDTEPAWSDIRDTWYGEERFDGWEYTDSQGETHLLLAGAEIEKTDNGFQVTDTQGSQVTLPSGTVLTGKWTEVSNVVTFFVNYKGTILDTEGDVTGRREETFTRSVAVGHVFYGKLKVGDDQKFGVKANEQITGAFSPKFTEQFDAENPETQIVIEYMRECTRSSGDGINYDTAMRLEAYGANSKAVETNTLNLLKETGRTIQVSTGNGSNPTIDNELCDSDHYQIRWYVMKEQTDTWHVDGVLVAKTSEIAVAKTFTGLTTDQAQSLLGGEKEEDKTDDFQIPVELGPDQQKYITITNQEVKGQYEYTGSETTANLPNSYHWTFHAITDEQYTLSESNYQLNGYDVSSIIVHYYKDAKTGTDQIKYTYGTSTQDFEDEADSSVIGGRTTAVSFNNFYTPTGTGAMAIVKRDSTTSENDVYGKLQGAEFTLYADENCESVVQTVTSNANGTAYFSNLAKNTYYLKETTAPDGYDASEKMWQVEVTEGIDDDGSSKIIVTLYELDADNKKVGDGNILYDGGIYGSYTVNNNPNASTVTVTKTFSGLTNAQMDAMVENSKLETDGTPNNDGYYISLKGNVSGSGEIDSNGKSSVTLCLSDAQRSQDNMSFTWTIHNLAVTQTVNGVSKPIGYVLEEYNYLSEDYADTVASMRLNGEEKSPKYIERDDNYAVFTGIEFRADNSDHIVLTNHYTNTFDMKLKKVDSKTGDALPGAKFSIYGPYRESTDTSNQVTYTDEDGKEQTYYFISDITSDENGIAEQKGLTLSKGENTFLYVLKEIEAPDTYIKLESPIVAEVTVDTDNYDGGVFSISAENTKEREAVLTLNTKKIWQPDVPSGKTVTLQLYRVEHTERGVPLGEVAEASLVTEITLNGTKDSLPGATEDTVEDDETTPEPAAYESEPWVATWLNIPAASGSEDGPHYHYFVREITELEGYTTAYECYEMYAGEKQKQLEAEEALQTLRVTDANGNSETFEAVLLADMAEDYMVEITNTKYYELPESGGTGTLLYTIGGALLSAGSLLCGYRLRRKKERRAKN